MRDGWIFVYTDAQTISNYANKIVLYYVCYTQVLQLTPLSVTIYPAYGVSCNICTSVTFSATVRKWLVLEKTLSVHYSRDVYVACVKKILI